MLSSDQIMLKKHALAIGIEAAIVRQGKLQRGGYQWGKGPVMKIRYGSLAESGRKLKALKERLEAHGFSPTLSHKDRTIKLECPVISREDANQTIVRMFQRMFY